MKEAVDGQPEAYHTQFDWPFWLQNKPCSGPYRPAF
jgi:hypothetical protein